MAKTESKTRRVKALQGCYVDLVYRNEGDVFEYSGDPAPGVLAEQVSAPVVEAEFDEPEKPKRRVVETRPVKGRKARGAASMLD